MLAIIIDVLVSFILAKYLQRLWVQIPLAVLGGIASMMVAFIAADIMAGSGNNYNVGAFVLGVFFHPFVTLIGLWYFRRKMGKNNAKSSNTKHDKEEALK